MHIIESIIEFLVSAWLWHFTYGLAQVISNMVILWVLLHIIPRLSWIRAGLLSLMAHTMTSLIFSTIVSFFLAHACHPNEIDADQYMVVYTNLHYITFSFAALYSFLLAIFFTGFNYVYRIPLLKVYGAVLISGLVSAFFAPLLCHT